MSKKNEWTDRLDQLKERFSIESDVVLAITIGISPAMLAHVRAGRRPLPLPARFRLMDKLGYTITRDLMLSVLPDDTRAVITEIDNRRLGQRMRKKATGTKPNDT